MALTATDYCIVGLRPTALTRAWVQVIHGSVWPLAVAKIGETLRGVLLAAYKVPKQVVLVESLPKSATGKIQKVNLREKFWSGTARQVGASSGGFGG